MNLPRLLLTRAAAFAALVLSLTPPPTRASLDVSPADGIPDIWAMRYGSGALLPTADTDGDGQKNSAEAAAGTNPTQPGSVIKITGVTADGTGVHLTFPTEQGKRYQVQTATTIAGATWVDFGTPLAPDNSGTLTVTNNAVGAKALFYRVRVQDIDSDGDGVSDWEELQIGFDPFNSHSNGLSAAGDLAAITAALSATNVVSVASTGVPVAEPAAPNVSADTSTFTITRAGNLNAITVNYSVGGSAAAGSDYVALSGSVSLGLGVNSATVTVTPLFDAVLESREAVILTVSASAAYTVGSQRAAAVLIDDRTTANGTGVTARFWNNTSATIPVFTNTSGATTGSATPVLTRIDPQIDNTWGVASPGAGVNADYFVSRFTGDVLPEFSQIYTFQGQVERGGRLWVNGQLLFTSWGNTPTAGTYSGTIELTGGQRASIVFEHMARSGDATAILRWQSTNQPLQVIPQARLFPNAPPQILSGLDMLLLRGSPVTTYQIVGTNDPTSYSAANLPAGWTVNTVTGAISINPTQTGTWQIPITATNALGSGSAILQVKVIATDSLITRDVWTGVVGNLVGDIPLTTAPTTTGTLTSLEGPQNSADNYGARIRGYITAPTTGTYKFWLTADEAAELWISDDEEPVNAFKRASLTAPVGYRNWAAGAATQLLYLEAGIRYYVEVRHKEGTGTDHVSVGWLKPTDTGAVASEVVPGYALSQYVAPTIIPGESTLYSTTMSAQGGAISSGYGTATLRVSADESVATLRFTFANLTTNLAASGRHIHAANHGGNIIFDIDTATPNADGTYTWNIAPVGAISVQDILNEIHGGTAYINIHTATYPAGEIRGFFALQAASQTFTPPLPPPSWTDDHANANAASRFLTQSTFGPTLTDIAAVQSSGYDAWIDSQFLISATHHLDFVYLHRNQTSPNGPTYYSDLSTDAWWQNSTLGADQLRQRIAFALNQILVVSTAGPLEDNARAVSHFYDTLLDKAFGNFRDILEAVTLTPGMGIYLDMRRNDKPSLTTGSHPNENYAREIKQLFSIGLNRLHPDGTLGLNSQGELIPTYGQDEIVGFAHVFTGWNYNQFDPATPPNPLPTNWSPAAIYTAPMTEVPSHHYTGQKRILNRVVLPGLAMVAGQPLDPYANHTNAQINDPGYQALPAQELDATHDALFNHPNCPPFICRQLIQRLVTSTPSLGYVYRVVSKFENNGSGVRGDMKAVIKAILLDYESRSTAVMAQQGYGKQREPVLRVTAITRAFAPPAAVSGTYTQDGGVISVDTSPTLHRLVAGNPVSLIFTGAPQSTNGEYSLSGTFPPTTTVFNMRTKDVIRSNYTQAGTTVNVATGNNGGTAHGLTTGDSVFLRFRDGAGKPADGMFAITVVDTGHFTVTVPTTATISTLANCDVAFLRGRYDQSGTTVTLTCETIHGLTTGGNIGITFVGAIGQGSLPAVGTYPITVVDDTHLTFTVLDSVGRVGYFVAGMDGPTLNRSGTASTAYSAWSVGNTETDIAQTPLRSPTVFNFYLPDYQYPGILANAGLVTPEFELTSETTVIRQANFLYNGIFNPTTTTGGISSFRSGGGDMAVDFGPWMGIKPVGTTPWTNNENVNALIDQLNTLLMAGQLPSTGVNNTASNPRVIVNARQAIYDFVTNTSNIAYTAAAPTDTQKRDRIRAIVHLIVTSPNFAIQK